MPSCDERFDLIDLHDAPVVACARADHKIEIDLGHVILSAEHPSSPTGTPVLLGPCRLAFCGVLTAEAKLFDDATQQWVAHPTPDRPLDADVVNSRVEDCGDVKRYVLAGMHRTGWSEWHIVAVGFTLQWDAILGDPWYVRANRAGS